jgi:tRNA 2-thiouridine synthesizing protein E
VREPDGTEKKVTIDEDGYIKDLGEWTEGFAYAVAKDEGIDQVTSEHMNVVMYLRKYYLEYETCPPISKVLKDNSLALRRLYELFPTGPAKGACRMAGAPKPTGCV